MKKKEQEKTFEWWLKYATRIELRTINDIKDCLYRLRDYTNDMPESYGYDKELSQQQRDRITYDIIQQMIRCINNLPKHIKEIGKQKENK